MDKIITTTIINSTYFWNGFFDVFFPALALATPFLIAIAVLSIVRRTKRNNRIMREELLKQNHCIIGCKNCNAQQCPNNPNYIRKLL